MGRSSDTFLYAPLYRLRHLLLAFYLLIVIYIVFFAGNDYRFRHLFTQMGSLNLVPLTDKIYFFRHPEIWPGNNLYFFLKEIIGNLHLLFPFPFVLMGAYGLTGKRTLLYSFILSVGIETLQLLSGIGNADIDDVLLNTTGALLATITVRFLQKRDRRHRE